MSDINVNEKLVETAARYYELQKKQKAIEEELKNLKETFIQVFKTFGVKDLTVGNYTVKWSNYQRDNFQPAKFKEEHPDMYENYVTKSEVNQIRINENAKID